MFDLTERRTPISADGIAVITLLQRTVEDSVAAPAGRTISSTQHVGKIAVFIPVVTQLPRIDPAVSAERRQRPDLFARQTSAFYAQSPASALRMIDAVRRPNDQIGRQQRGIGHERTPQCVRCFRIRATNAGLIGQRSAHQTKHIAVRITPQRTLISQTDIAFREERRKRGAEGRSGRTRHDDFWISTGRSESRFTYQARRTVGRKTCFAQKIAVRITRQIAFISQAMTGCRGNNGSRTTHDARQCSDRFATLVGAAERISSTRTLITEAQSVGPPWGA